MKSDKSSDHLEDYVLSKSLVSADGDAVRSMCLMETAPTDDTSNTNKLLVMGSQSGWITTYSINTTYEQIHSFQGGHSHAITALVSYEKNKFVSGCKDSIIRVFDMSDADNTDNITQLVGHTNAVTSFSLVYFSSSSSTTKPFLLSGSWDGTAKLWNDDTTCLTTLEGHENTVCVQGLPPSSSTTTSSSVLPSNNNNYYYYATVVTGSAGIAYGNVISEMKIRLWDITLVDSTTTNYKPTTSCTATLRACITDHLGPIRGLCYNPINHYFASISNDGSLKLRDCSTGTTVQSFQHSTNTSNDEPPLLLTVTTLGNGIYITGTEDGYAYVWNTTGITSNTPQQIILHPNTIWQVLPYSTSTATTTTTSNNEEDEEDFMTACHDGYVRIFTKSIQRMATPEELTTFTTQVQTATAARSGSDAGGGGGGPSMEEILKLPHWENRHQKVGTSEGQIQLFQKQQEEEGTPYAIAAQWCSGTWIEVGQVVGSDQRQKEVIDGVPYDHVIPIEVDTSTSGTLHLQIGYNTGDNPFVVAQEFIDRHQLEQHYLAQIADYIRERTSPKKPTFLDNPSLQKPKQQHSTAKTLEYLPTKSFLLFDSGTEKSTMNKIVSKVKEIHSSTTNNNSSNELLLLDRLVTTICATNRYHTSTVSKEELLLLSHWISTWPLEHIFPVLDLTRLVVLHPDASNMHNVDFWQQVIQATVDKCNDLLGVMEVEGATSDPSPTVSVAIPMLSMRFFANSFKGSGSSSAIVSNLDSVLRVAAQFITHYSTNKNVRLSVVTMVLNASSYLYTSYSFHGLEEPLFSLGGAMLHVYVSKYPNEESTVLRILLALGTLVLLLQKQMHDMVTSQEVANQLLSFIDIRDRLVTITTAKETAYGSKVQAVAKEILSVLGSAS